MKLKMMCLKCFSETEDLPNGPRIYHGFVIVGNDATCHLSCPKGHQTITVLTQQNFEVLLALGTYAIVDGYYREAVSSFASSLERFYEYYIKVIAIKHGVSTDELKNAWDKIGKQSERQLGSFIFSYLLENKKAPDVLPSKKVEFRNEVIHKGLIPTRTKAEEFGVIVLQLIRSHYSQLSEVSYEAMGELYTSNMLSIVTAIKKDTDQHPGTYSNPRLSPLFPNFDDEEPNTLKDELERVTQIRRQQAKYPYGYWTEGRVMQFVEPAEEF